MIIHNLILDLFIIDFQKMQMIMKRHITYMLFATAALGMIGSTMSNSFADTATVSIPSGTSVPGCEETNDCFIPII